MRLDVLIEGRLAGSLDIANPTEPVFWYDDGYRASAGARSRRRGDGESSGGNLRLKGA